MASQYPHGTGAIRSILKSSLANLCLSPIDSILELKPCKSLSMIYSAEGIKTMCLVPIAYLKTHYLLRTTGPYFSIVPFEQYEFLSV